MPRVATGADREQAAGVVADELLAHLRSQLDCDVDYLEAPLLLGGGSYSANASSPKMPRTRCGPPVASVIGRQLATAAVGYFERRTGVVLALGRR